MLLAVDIGNTTVRFGLFKGKKLIKHWRVLTSSLDRPGILPAITDPSKISGIIISCVVPGLLFGLKKRLNRIFGLDPLVVGCDINPLIPNLYRKPKQVGSDRLVNAVAGYHFYGGPLLIVDFGTAITFDVISKKGEYLGGIIAPGVELSLDALFKKTALLPRVKLSKPRVLVGKTTAESMISGIVYGFSFLCDGIIFRIKKRYRAGLRVVATGGGAKIIGPYCKNIDRINPVLTLQGLKIIYETGLKIDKNKRNIKKRRDNKRK